MKEIAQEVRRPVIAALARCHEKDIDLAGEALQGAARGRIHVFISTSDIHLEHKLKISREEAIERARAAIRQARRYTDDVEFSAEDASRTDRDFLCTIVAMAVETGATTINLPDTVGYALPSEYAAMFREVIVTDARRRRGDLERPLSRRPRPGHRPTRWPPSRRGWARSSAPSTGSASGPATRPWRRS